MPIARAQASAATSSNEQNAQRRNHRQPGAMRGRHRRLCARSATGSTIEWRLGQTGNLDRDDGELDVVGNRIATHLRGRNGRVHRRQHRRRHDHRTRPTPRFGRNTITRGFAFAIEENIDVLGKLRCSRKYDRCRFVELKRGMILRHEYRNRNIGNRWNVRI